MKIGELAKISGVSASAIRFYEQKGLIPQVARRPSGYRIYNNEAVNRLLLIKFSQKLGFSLDELPKLFTINKDVDHSLIIEKLHQKKQDLIELQLQLDNKKLKIIELINKLNMTWAMGQCLPQDELAAILSESNF